MPKTTNEKFQNGAVIANELGQFLAVDENDEDRFFWKNETTDALLFETPCKAEEFLNEHNKKYPECILSHVRIAEAPIGEDWEENDVCSEDGQNSTMPEVGESPCNGNDDENENYHDWTRNEVIEEIDRRELEGDFDTDEDSTDELREVLIADDTEARKFDEVGEYEDDEGEEEPYEDDVDSVISEIEDIKKQIASLQKRKQELKDSL